MASLPLRFASRADFTRSRTFRMHLSLGLMYVFRCSLVRVPAAHYTVFRNAEPSSLTCASPLDCLSLCSYCVRGGPLFPVQSLNIIPSFRHHRSASSLRHLRRYWLLPGHVCHVSGLPPLLYVGPSNGGHLFYLLLCVVFSTLPNSS